MDSWDRRLLALMEFEIQILLGFSENQNAHLHLKQILNKRSSTVLFPQTAIFVSLLTSFASKSNINFRYHFYPNAFSRKEKRNISQENWRESSLTADHSGGSAVEVCLPISASFSLYFLFLSLSPFFFGGDDLFGSQGEGVRIEACSCLQDFEEPVVDDPTLYISRHSIIWRC